MLLLMYRRYEVARGEAPKDATYFANAHVLLHDDTCFRFASLPGNQVSFQMMDPDKSEVPAGEPAVQTAAGLLFGRHRQVLIGCYHVNTPRRCRLTAAT